MLEPDGSPNTAHSLNPVPVIVTAEGAALRDGGILADVAPTILELLGIDQPEAMTGRSLLAGWDGARRRTTRSTGSTACRSTRSSPSATRWPSSCAPAGSATRRPRSRR